MVAAKETRLNVRINPEDLNELKRFAEANDMSLSEFVLRASKSFMGKKSGLEGQVLNLSRRLLDVEQQLAEIKQLQRI